LDIAAPAALAGVTLDAEALARLDEIVPGHRTLSEDHAW
jgi:hypothetical protein